VDAERFTVPVAALILKPAVDVNVPATPPPLKEGEGLLPLWQKGLPIYEKVATGVGVTVTITVIGVPGQPFADGVIV
jgi:hypothetical protein